MLKDLPKKEQPKTVGLPLIPPKSNLLKKTNQKPSPAKKNLREILDYYLKRKYAQLHLARKKKKELEDQEMNAACCVELQDFRHEIVQIETKMRSYNDKLDDLADEELSEAVAV